MNKIIMPGDPEWSGPVSKDTEYTPQEAAERGKDALEKVLQGVVEEVKDQVELGTIELPAPVEEVKAPEEPAKPGPTYKFHRPAQNRFISIRMPNGPMKATLLESLPRSWERKCFVGGFDYVTVEGQPYKTRVQRPGFRKGDTITITDATFVMGQGMIYGFAEGTRGGFSVRPDQIAIQAPMDATNPEGATAEVMAPEGSVTPANAVDDQATQG